MKKYLHYIKELFVFDTKKCALIICGCIITILSLVFFIRFLFFPYTGLITNRPEITIRNNVIYFTPHTFFSPALNDGLKAERDVFLKIDNTEITSVKSFLRTLYRKTAYLPVVIKVKRDDSRILTIPVQPELMLLRIDWIFTFFLLCVCIIIGFLILIYVHEKKYYLFAVSLFFYMLFISVNPFYYENIYSFLIAGSGSSYTLFLFIFSLYYPFPRGKKRIRHAITGAACSLCIVLLIISVYLYMKWDITESDLWYQYLLIFEKFKLTVEICIMTFFLLLLLYAFIKGRSKKIKNQLRWILSGFLISFSPYFFFEYLPRVFGDFSGENIYLGHIAHLFICIFPIFFLIGIYDHIRTKYQYIIPELSFYFISIPLFFLFFLVIAPSSHSYLMKYYGFSTSIAYQFSAFLYILFFQPLIIIGMKFIGKYFSFNKYINSSVYISSLKSKNIVLNNRLLSQMQYNKARLQEDKIKDLSEIMKGIYNRINQGIEKISKDLLHMKKKVNKLSELIKESNMIDKIEINENNKDFYNLAGNIIEENLKLKEFLKHIHNQFSAEPSLFTEIGFEYIIQKAVAAVCKTYSSCSIRIEAGLDNIIYCCPSELIKALIYLLTYIIESSENQECEIGIKSFKDENKYYIIVECQNIEKENVNVKKIFRLFVKNGYHGFGLYIPKVLIEKNYGNISAVFNENGINFIITLSLKNR